MKARIAHAKHKESVMKFHVGPMDYDIFISLHPLLDEDDLPVASLYSWRFGHITLSCDLPDWRRIDAMFYELARAWDNHLGFPAEHDDRANRMASFSIEMFRQFNEQGGDEALRALQPSKEDEESRRTRRKRKSND
jgi:hypothetical protein